ncbi:MAG: hypothetical protein DI498_11005 [Paracoccus denitrificans]|nr:MAG: hypothetical protein DI498_11005 [Paracoccus denitrificans]PZO83669.1 MAG: hypothetical protein DI633_11005 [Paracoccus denitrificans]
MAFSFPLALDQFWTSLPIASCSFIPSSTVMVTRTRGGEVMRAEIGSRLWTATVRLGLMTRAEAATVVPMLHLLRGGAGSFFAFDPLRAFPRGDFGGASLAQSSVVIRSIAANSRELTLSGLPPYYTLQRGDMLAFSYGSNPVRYGLHQVVTASVRAWSTGITPTIEVVPPLRSGASVNLAVSLVQPACKMVLDPDSYDPGSERSGGVVEGVSFSMQQSLR